MPNFMDILVFVSLLCFKVVKKCSILYEKPVVDLMLIRCKQGFNVDDYMYIVGSRGASQPGGSLLGIPLGYKAN